MQQVTSVKMLSILFQLILLKEDVELEKILRDYPEKIKERHNGYNLLTNSIIHDSRQFFNVLIREAALRNMTREDINAALRKAVSSHNKYFIETLLEANVRFGATIPNIDVALYNDNNEIVYIINIHHPEIGTGITDYFFETNALSAAILVRAEKCVELLGKLAPTQILMNRLAATIRMLDYYTFNILFSAYENQQPLQFHAVERCSRSIILPATTKKRQRKKSTSFFDSRQLISSTQVETPHSNSLRICLLQESL